MNLGACCDSCARRLPLYVSVFAILIAAMLSCKTLVELVHPHIPHPFTPLYPPPPPRAAGMLQQLAVGRPVGSLAILFAGLLPVYPYSPSTHIPHPVHTLAPVMPHSSAAGVLQQLTAVGRAVGGLAAQGGQHGLVWLAGRRGHACRNPHAHCMRSGSSRLSISRVF